MPNEDTLRDTQIPHVCSACSHYKRGTCELTKEITLSHLTCDKWARDTDPCSAIAWLWDTPIKGEQQ